MEGKKIKRVLQKHSRSVDPIIKKLLSENVNTKTRELLHYQINSGGKRLRPALAIESCLACGGKTKDVLIPASGLEILHSQTLIIDDIIDNSPERRGEFTVWKKFGKSFAECAALDYGATLLNIVSKSDKKEELSKIYAKTLKVVVDGEIKDILMEQAGREDEEYFSQNRSKKVSLEDYKKMIGEKTAYLIRSSCDIGALFANASSRWRIGLQNYGECLGMAFQIIDDVLDFFGEKTGKPLGQDIREQKLGNIVFLLALEESVTGDRSVLRGALQEVEVSDKKVLMVIDLIKKTKAKEKALDLASVYIKEAKSCLSVLPESSHKFFLESVADFVVSRDH